MASPSEQKKKLLSSRNEKYARVSHPYSWTSRSACAQSSSRCGARVTSGRNTVTTTATNPKIPTASSAAG